MGRYIPDPTSALTRIHKKGVEKSPVHISVNRLKVDENVNKANFGTHWLAVK